MPDTHPHDPETGHDAGPDAGTDAGTDEQATGRDRLATSMRRPTRAQVGVGVLLAALGFAAVTQVQSNEASNNYASLRQQDLIEVLGGLTGAAERARREVERLEATRRQLESETRGRQAALEAAQERLRALNMLAGLVPVHGPGIRITITETEGRVSVGSLLDIVQELRTAGAEAMEFNNSVRVIAQSSFDETAGGIELDGRLLTSPYVIEVIGDPHTLHTGLTFTSGPIEKLENEDGATVEVEELEEIDIASVREEVQPEHATPNPEQ